MQEHIYEIYYEMQDGGIIYCGDRCSFEEAQVEVTQLSLEFPEYCYWIEKIEVGGEW